MTKRETLLTPKHVAELLQVSLNTARRIMRENGAIYVGAQLRWTSVKLERYLRLGDRSHAATAPVIDAQQAPAERTNPQCFIAIDEPNETDPFLRPIQPRTKRKRS